LIPEGELAESASNRAGSDGGRRDGERTVGAGDTDVDLEANELLRQTT
jgi:hypothetical protein